MIIKTLGLLLCFTALIAATCDASSYSLPKLEIHVPVSVSTYGGITSIQERVISTIGGGFKLGDIGVSLDEAAEVAVEGGWAGADFVAKYRQKYSIHGDSYLAMKLDKRVSDRNMYERGWDYIDIGQITVDEFGFSNGDYFTKQGSADIRINNGVFTDGNSRMDLNQAYYGPRPLFSLVNGDNSFVGIESRGIPVVGYLYKDSEGTNAVKAGKVRAKVPQIVTINGQKYCRFAFTKNFSSKKSFTDMYFFTMTGKLVKYGYERLEIQENNMRNWWVGLYDVYNFTTHIPDKNCFKNPPQAQMIKKSLILSYDIL